MSTIPTFYLPVQLTMYETMETWKRTEMERYRHREVLNLAALLKLMRRQAKPEHAGSLGDLVYELVALALSSSRSDDVDMCVKSRMLFRALFNGVAHEVAGRAIADFESTVAARMPEVEALTQRLDQGLEAA